MDGSSFITLMFIDIYFTQKLVSWKYNTIPNHPHCEMSNVAPEESQFQV